ncbi:MAG: RHS repeat-associated core domain-containing protein [Paludibacteraceae bacterium]
MRLINKDYSSVGDILDLEITNVLNYAYNDNMVYIDYNNRGLWELDHVHTPVGYVRYYGPEEHYPFYYIRDYLGNVREVWVHPWLNHSEYVQRTQYYPSGLPWNEGYSPSEQPYKYGGKEFVEMHGLDEYDSEARWYYPAIMRTTTMDPHCEQYYDTSPYVWCGNNPIRNVDLNGEAWKATFSYDSIDMPTPNGFE